MEFIPIFASSGTNLYAVKYKNEKLDEFERLFELWHDPEYLEGFLEANKDDLNNGHFGIITIEEIIKEINDEAYWLEEKLLELSKLDAKTREEELDKLFVPLDDLQTNTPDLDQRKAKSKRKKWIRIYGIRIDENFYLITGGAIKLTHKMKENEHTAIELRKLEVVGEYLKEQGISDKYGFIELISEI